MILIGSFFIPIFNFVLINLSSYDNIGGHTVGYVLGFFSGYGNYLVRAKKNDKYISQ
jgi:hypothetical protein